MIPNETVQLAQGLGGKLESKESVSSHTLPSKNVLELEAKKKISKNSPPDQEGLSESLEKYGIIRSFKKWERDSVSEKDRELLGNSIRYSTDNSNRLKTELDEMLQLSRRESRQSTNLAQVDSIVEKTQLSTEYFKIQQKSKTSESLIKHPA